jgi:uncharacterized RDD family membrane protein YckC
LKALNISTFFNIDLYFDLANPGRRYLAYLIDWIIKVAYIFLISATTGFDVFSKFNATLFMFIIFSPFIFYSFLMEWLNKGQTIGKMIMGIKVVGLHGAAPSISQCAIRWMFLLVDEYLFILFINVSELFIGLVAFSPLVGCLFIGISDKNQRIGDIAAGTYLVKSKETVHSIFDTIYSYASIPRNNYEPIYPEVIKLSDRDMTIVKKLLERSEENFDYNLATKLANHIKNILQLSPTENNELFLKQLLKDYNYLSVTTAK